MFVYAMLSETGEVKIGKSVCPETRAPKIAQEFHTNIIDMQYIRCDALAAKVERLCHIIHESWMVSREWFYITFKCAVHTIRIAKEFYTKYPSMKPQKAYEEISGMAYARIYNYRDDIRANVPFETRFPYEKNRDNK